LKEARKEKLQTIREEKANKRGESVSSKDSQRHKGKTNDKTVKILG